MTDQWEEIEKMDDGDVYSEEARDKQVDDDELEDWQGAWMQGYDEG